MYLQESRDSGLYFLPRLTFTAFTRQIETANTFYSSPSSGYKTSCDSKHWDAESRGCTVTPKSFTGLNHCLLLERSQLIITLPERHKREGREETSEGEMWRQRVKAEVSDEDERGLKRRRRRSEADELELHSRKQEAGYSPHTVNDSCGSLESQLNSQLTTRDDGLEKIFTHLLMRTCKTNLLTSGQLRHFISMENFLWPAAAANTHRKEFIMAKCCHVSGCLCFYLKNFFFFFHGWLTPGVCVCQILLWLMSELLLTLSFPSV